MKIERKKHLLAVWIRRPLSARLPQKWKREGLSLPSRMGVLETYADVAYSNTVAVEVMDSQDVKRRQR